MKRIVLLFQALCLSVSAFGGFKVKNVRPKKPEQYQVRATVGGVTYAADLLLEGKDQKDFFYKELTPSNIIAVRLAIFNNSRNEVILPDGIQLLAPGGKELPLLAPESVARAVLDGPVVPVQAERPDRTAQPSPTIRAGDPRVDRTDPRYDPRLDPNDPSYDPTDPRNRPMGDPRYDPNDPRNGPVTDPRYGNPRYDPRYGGYGVPSVIVSPRVGGGGGGAGLSQYEKQLAEKDYIDKAHSSDPIDGMMIRDRFLYFSLGDRPMTAKGFMLRIPKSKGIPEEIVLKF